MQLASRNNFARLLASLAVVGATVAGCGGETGNAADSSKPYYEGKTIEIISTASPGGGSDTAARLLAEFMGKNIEGNPTVQVVNLQGAGGIRGGNEFATKRAHDGTSLLMISSTALLPYLLGADGVEYDLKQMNAVWTIPSSKLVYGRTDARIEQLSDLADPPVPLLTPATSPEDNDVDVSTVFEALGILDKIKTVYGYEGSNEAAQSVVSGETNINAYGVGSFVRSFQTDVDNGTLKELFAFGLPDGNGSVLPDPNLPDLPTAADAYRELHNGAEPTGEAWDAFLMLTEIHAWSVLNFADVPDEAAQALNAGIEKAITDPGYLEKLKAISPYQPQAGAEAKSWSDNLSQLDPALVDWLKGFIDTLS